MDAKRWKIDHKEKKTGPTDWRCILKNLKLFYFCICVCTYIYVSTLYIHFFTNTTSDNNSISSHLNIDGELQIRKYKKKKNKNPCSTRNSYYYYSMCVCSSLLLQSHINNITWTAYLKHPIKHQLTATLLSLAPNSPAGPKLCCSCHHQEPLIPSHLSYLSILLYSSLLLVPSDPPSSIHLAVPSACLSTMGSRAFSSSGTLCHQPPET